MRNYGQSDRGGDRRSFSGGGDRQMYQAVCSKCGKDCRVPFMPSGDKPVYCSDCFERNGPSASSGFDRPRRDFGSKSFGGDRPYSSERSSNPQSQNQNNDLLVSINAKLGKILELMAATKSPVEIEKKVVKKTKKIEPEKLVSSLE